MPKMIDEEKETLKKFALVKGELFALVKKLYKDVCDMSYGYEDGEEYVTVAYSSGAVLRVCVTGQSLAALCVKVMKNI